MGVHSSVPLCAREVLLEDDVDKLSEWLVFRARQTGNSQHALVKRKDLLHQACEAGASRCARYIADLFPSVVNMQDKTGRSVLQCALLDNSMDKAHFACAYTLLESDAAFNKLAFEARDSSILHEICAECDSPDHAKVVKMVLKRAGRTLAKSLIDHGGNTPLHSLFKLSKLNEHIFSGDNPRAITNDPTLLQKYFAVLRVCAELLLSKGCDPNRANSQGQTALSMLLAHGEQFKGRQSLAACPQISSAYIRGVNWVMEVLLKYGANPNKPAPSGDMPLVLYVKTLQRFGDFENISNDILNGLRLLCQGGADPNITSKREKKHSRHTSNRTPGSGMRTVILSAFAHCIRYNRYQAPELNIIWFLRESLHILQKHGLNTGEVLAHDLGLLLGMFSVSRFPLQPEFVAEFKDFLKDLLQMGSNPNLIPFLSSSQAPNGFSVPDSLARALTMQGRYETVDVMGIVHVFYCSLDQRNLNELIKATIHELETLHAGPLSQRMVAELRELTKQPRGLQDLARVAVYKAGDWRLADCADELSLPNALKRYLHDLD